MMQHLTGTTLIDYLHHELSPAQDAEVLAHLEGCAACKRELNVEATITDRLRAVARAQELEMPLGLRSAIMIKIASLEAAGPAGALRRLLRPVLLVPFAAAVAAAAFFISPVLAPQPTQTAALPVSYYLEQHAVRAQENPLGDRGTIILSSLTSNDGLGAR